MTLARAYCVPPDLAEQVIGACSEMVKKGLQTAPETPMGQLIQDIKNKRAMLWLILEDKEALATAVTEIVPDDNGAFVAIFGLGGRDMWKWARTFLQEIEDYARSEHCTKVKFAGSKAWGRILPRCRLVGTLEGQNIYERAVQ